MFSQIGTCLHWPELQSHTQRQSAIAGAENVLMPMASNAAAVRIAIRDLIFQPPSHLCPLGATAKPDVGNLGSPQAHVPLPANRLDIRTCHPADMVDRVDYLLGFPRPARGFHAGISGLTRWAAEASRISIRRLRHGDDVDGARRGAGCCDQRKGGRLQRRSARSTGRYALTSERIARTQGSYCSPYARAYGTMLMRRRTRWSRLRGGFERDGGPSSESPKGCTRRSSQGEQLASHGGPR